MTPPRRLTAAQRRRAAAHAPFHCPLGSLLGGPPTVRGNVTPPANLWTKPLEAAKGQTK